jgi:hypothetical protein
MMVNVVVVVASSSNTAVQPGGFITLPMVITLNIMIINPLMPELNPSA